MRSPPRPVRRGPPRFATQWVGRSIRKECRSFARRRFCSCCWEISAVPVVEFSRYAATLPSRAPPIFPRYTTFFPAISRCRVKATRLFSIISINTQKNRPLVELPEVHREYAQGVLRETRHSGKRFRLRFPSETHRQPFLFRISLRHARWENGGHVSDGTKSGRRCAELAASTQGAIEIEMAGCARDG